MANMDRREDVLRLVALRRTLTDAARLAAEHPQLRVMLALALAQEEEFAKARLAHIDDGVRN